MLLSPPRPFGKLAVFIGDASETVGQYDPNGKIINSYLQIRMLWKLFSAIEEDIQNNILVPPAVKSKVSETVKAIEVSAGPMLVGTSGDIQVIPYEWDSLPTPRTETSGAPHYFGDPLVTGKVLISQGRDLMLTITGYDDIDLAVLNLPAQREPLVQAAVVADDAFDTKFQAIKSQYSNSCPPLGEITILSALALADVEANKAVLKLYHEFQRMFGEKTGLSKTHWDSRFVDRKLKQLDWRLKATYTVHSMAEFTSLTTLVKPLSGIVYFDSDQIETFSKLKVAGKLMVVCACPVEIHDVGVLDPAFDQLTFICFKDVSLGGQVRASIIVGKAVPYPQLSAEAGTTIYGNLVVAGPLRIGMTGLAGSLKYDPLLDSGDTGQSEKLNHHYVALAPPARFRTVSRR